MTSYRWISMAQDRRRFRTRRSDKVAKIFLRCFTTKLGVIVRLDRATQYGGALIIDREALEYRVTRLRG
jgi:hypothetical protein